MSKQLDYERIDELYAAILNGKYTDDTVKELIELENKQQTAEGKTEMWHLPGEQPEREIKYDEDIRSNEKLIAIVKTRFGKCKIIAGHLVEKRGALRFEGFKYKVEDIVCWRLIELTAPARIIKE